MATETPKHRFDHLVGIGLSVVSAICFGTVAPLAKVAYDRGAEPLALLTVRFGVAGIFLVIFLKIRSRKLWQGRRLTSRLASLGAIGYALEASLFFIALELAPAGIVSLVFFSFPLIATVMGFALGLEPLRRSTIVALVIGSVGVATIFNIEGVNVAGPLVALAAAFAVSIYLVGAAKVTKGVDSSVAAAWTAIGAAASLAVISPLAGQTLPLKALPIGLAIGGVTTIAFLALYGALARIGMSRTAVAQMLEPVVTVVIAALFLDEIITLRIAIGAALVISALPILASTTHREEAPPPADSL